MDAITHWLKEPVMVWHLVVAGFLLWGALISIDRRLTAIGKGVWRIIEKSKEE
jgi:hypothetical protein